MSRSPPLYIWLCSATLAAAVVGAFAAMHWSSTHTPDNAVALHAKQFLDAKAQQAPMRVLGLGSSLLWAATPPGWQPKMQDIAWMRMTKPGPGLGYLQPALEMAEHNRPDVLVIEQNLLLPEVEESEMDKIRKEFLVITRNWANRLAGSAWITPAQAYLPLADQREQLVCPEIPHPIRQQYILRKARELRPLFDSEKVDLVLSGKLQRLSERGVHIVLLEIRRSALAEQTIEQQKRRWQERLRQALPPGPHVSYLTAPDFARQDLFCDGSHLNQTGAVLFADWWRSELQQLRVDQ